YLAQLVKDVTIPKDESKITASDIAANAMAHAVVGAVVAQLSGQDAAAGAMGASSGELIARAIMADQYPGKTANDLTEEEKQSVSALSTLASGLVSGLASNSTASAASGAQSGRNAVENNALSSKDEKQRQDAKWSLPYLEGEKKAQAEQLVANLDAKDGAFDAAIDAACKNLSSAACQGMRQELAAMAKSYDEQLDGQYIGTMASIYKEGKGQVDGLMWQYATADAQAQKTKNIQTIASNWGVSIETASALYTGMAAVHTTAAIGGAVYGMKTTVPDSKGVVPALEAGEYSIVKPGPLKPSMAETFSGGRYQEKTFTEDTILYRAGVSETPFGQYFSFEKPTSVIQTRIDKAVLPVWPTGDKSPIDTSFGIKIPAGTKYYIGEVGSQSGFYVGGTQQVVIPTPWKLPGVEVISKEPLK
ncbi:VENN motif pre-toxin domain-containing protein, partial [Pectobacterium odoriferum]|uniref:VENN motif pre-toxin domain-containing protein n=2 Tax=Pectobacterium odoriferum TaxID=78398 RepID=UPI000D3F3115